MRLFAGTFLGPSNQLECRQIVDRLVGRHPGVLRGIPSGSAHLTYAFMADTGDWSLDDLVDTIGRRIASCRPFDVRFVCARILPRGSRPRLVCLEIDKGGVELQRLSTEVAAAVRTACPDLDFAPGKSPHLTLARFRKQAGRDDARAVGQSLAAWPRADPLPPERIDHISLVESILTPSGPVYEIRRRVPLSGGIEELA